MKSRFIATSLAALICTGVANVNAEETTTAAVDQETADLAAISDKMNNPVSDLWMLFAQNDTYFYEDAAGKDYTINSFKFQPVMSFRATEDYNLIVRPVFQHMSLETPTMDRESGMGDTALMAMMGPSEIENGNIWGVGFTSIFPTATEKQLTTQGKDQTAIGPALTYFHIGETWTYGGILQHYKGVGSAETYGGLVEDEDINLTDFQYVARYRFSPFAQVGFGPNIQVDWNEEGSDRFSIPIGFGGDIMTKIGSLPVRIGAELHYYVKQPDEFGPQWNLRLFAVPVIANPTL